MGHRSTAADRVFADNLARTDPPSSWDRMFGNELREHLSRFARITDRRAHDVAEVIRNAISERQQEVARTTYGGPWIARPPRPERRTQ